MKLSQIPRGSAFAYREAVEMVRDQILFELETCERMLGTDAQKVLDLLAQEIPNRKLRGRHLAKRQTGRICDRPHEDESER